MTPDLYVLNWKSSYDVMIIFECSTIYTSSRKQTTKINELLPLHNVKYEKNTDLSGRPIRKKFGFRLYNAEKQCTVTNNEISEKKGYKLHLNIITYYLLSIITA
jgi:hypothetical protein